MVCMDGFILTHATSGSTSPAGPGRQVRARLRAPPGARSSRPGLDRRHGRPGGLHRGPLPRARTADPGAGPHPRGRRGIRRRVRPRLRRPGTALPHAGRRDHRHCARLGARHHQGRHRRDAGRRREDRRARHHLVPAVPARGRRCRAGRRAAASSCWRRRWPWASAASWRRTCGWHSSTRAATRMATPSSPGSAAAPSPRHRCTTCSPARRRDQLEPLTFLDLNTELVDRELTRTAATSTVGARRGEHPARSWRGCQQDRMRSTTCPLSP